MTMTTIATINDDTDLNLLSSDELMEILDKWDQVTLSSGSVNDDSRTTRSTGSFHADLFPEEGLFSPQPQRELIPSGRLVVVEFGDDFAKSDQDDECYPIKCSNLNNIGDDNDAMSDISGSTASSCDTWEDDLDEDLEQDYDMIVDSGLEDALATRRRSSHFTFTRSSFCSFQDFQLVQGANIMVSLAM